MIVFDYNFAVIFKMKEIYLEERVQLNDTKQRFQRKPVDWWSYNRS